MRGATLRLVDLRMIITPGLELLPDVGFGFFAVPVKVQGFGTFPVRAFAELGPNG